MSLSALPRELIQLIADELGSQHAINALAQSNRALFAQINPFLYEYHVRHHVPASALDWAAEHDDVELLKRLLDAGADLYTVRPWWWGRSPVLSRSGRHPGPSFSHPIFTATSKGHVKFIEALLDSGMSTRLNDSDYYALMLRATKRNQANVVKMLIGRGANPWTPDSGLLDEAVRRRSITLVEILMEDASQRKSLSPIPEWGNKTSNALITAVKRGDDGDITQILIAAGADINFADQGCAIYRPLTYATCAGHMRTCRLLLEAGADPNIDNDGKWGPLAGAVGQFILSGPSHHRFPSQEQKDECIDRVRLLLDYGADPARAGGGWALHGALRSLNFDLASLIANKGARIQVSELRTSDQVVLDRAVVEHDWGTVMRLTPWNWSIQGYAGPGLIRTGERIVEYRMPMDGPGGIPPWGETENHEIDKCEVPPPPWQMKTDSFRE